MADNPLAIVTGAASGIGAATAAELMDRGWAVAGLDLSPATACSTWAQVDMTDGRAVAAAVESAQTEFGAVQAAVSVAGYYEMFPICDISVERWERMLNVHLGGLYNLTRAVLPTMLEQRTGSLVAITSELAVGGGGDDSHYAAAKGALIGFIRSLAPEVAETGVRVNAVAPGPTDTPLLEAESPWRAQEYLNTLPGRGLVTPDQVALCVAYLLDEGGFCTGEILNVNAGAVI
jgi:NAD(P)-dependent dehydrogenase (short-subunit alcohol dehydrogenase family)